MRLFCFRGGLGCRGFGLRSFSRLLFGLHLLRLRGVLLLELLSLLLVLLLDLLFLRFGGVGLGKLLVFFGLLLRQLLMILGLFGGQSILLLLILLVGLGVAGIRGGGLVGRELTGVRGRSGFFLGLGSYGFFRRFFGHGFLGFWFFGGRFFGHGFLGFWFFGGRFLGYGFLGFRFLGGRFFGYGFLGFRFFGRCCGALVGGFGLGDYSFGFVSDGLGLGNGCGGRSAMVGGRAHLRVGASFLHARSLRGDWRDVVLASRSFFLSCGVGLHSTGAAVEANAGVVFDDGGVVSVVDDGGVYAIDGSVVFELVVIPAATLVAVAACIQNRS